MRAFDQILVVCVGNICRSPMAAAILTAYYPEKHIDSAGLSALVGHAADAKAVALMATHNIDISAHIAKQIDEALVSQSDLILTMTGSHLHALLQVYPHIADKAFTLHEYVYNMQKDVSDPYGGSVDVYRRTFEELQRLIDALQSKIVED